MKIVTWLIEKKLGWKEHDDAAPVDQVIDDCVWHLIDEIKKAEAKWGIGRLEKNMSFEMNKKWNNQCRKLKDAIEGRDYELTRELTQGAIRGIEAIEKEAIKNGFANFDDFAWSFDLGDKVYVFCKNIKDSRLINAVMDKEKKYEIVTIEEAAIFMLNDFERRMELVNKEQDKKVVTVDDFDFEKGDDIPF